MRSGSERLASDRLGSEMGLHPVSDERLIEIRLFGQNFEVFVSEVLRAISAHELNQVEIGSNDLLASTAGRQTYRIRANREIAKSNFEYSSCSRVHSMKRNRVLQSRKGSIFLKFIGFFDIA